MQSVAQAVDKANQRAAEKPPSTPLPTNELMPPAYGQAQREAVSAVVDNMVEVICQRTKMLRKQLDEIESLALQGSGKAKHMLSEQISLCTRLGDEVSRSEGVIADLLEAARANKE
jgi:hypothetical protein